MGFWFLVLVVYFVCFCFCFWVVFVWVFLFVGGVGVGVEVSGLKLGGMRHFLFPTLLICCVGHLETFHHRVDDPLHYEQTLPQSYILLPHFNDNTPLLV